MDAELVTRTDFACSIARNAGVILREHYGKLRGYDHKGLVDLVTIADKASEAYLVDTITQQYPDDSILGEEGSSIEGTNGWQWIIDPLDGTTNFVHGYPFFMVSIGLRLNTSRVAGVCYGPILDELYSARRGDGAKKNGQPIHVSQTPELSSALIATGFPYNRRDIADELLGPVRRVIKNTHGIRRGGAAAYDQCFLASGQVDGFFEIGLSPWDTAAGSLIIEEAGGLVESYNSAEWNLDSQTILASNGHIQQQLRQVVTVEDDA